MLENILVCFVNVSTGPLNIVQEIEHATKSVQQQIAHTSEHAGASESALRKPTHSRQRMIHKKQNATQW